MSNHPFKTAEDFNRWKETNPWLWEYFHERMAELEAQTEAYARNILVCPEDQMHNIRVQANVLLGRASSYGELINMNFPESPPTEEAP